MLDNGAMGLGRGSTFPSRNEATIGAAAESQIVPFDCIDNELIKKVIKGVNSKLGFQSDGYLEPELLKLAKPQFLSQTTVPFSHCDLRTPTSS